MKISDKRTAAKLTPNTKARPETKARIIRACASGGLPHKKLAASDLTATQAEIVAVARFLA